jgi:hypothetical protein
MTSFFVPHKNTFSSTRPTPLYCSILREIPNWASLPPAQENGFFKFTAHYICSFFFLLPPSPAGRKNVTREGIRMKSEFCLHLLLGRSAHAVPHGRKRERERERDREREREEVAVVVYILSIC